ncbi:MAG: folate hydrolase, partial [Segetibacter sp.]
MSNYFTKVLIAASLVLPVCLYAQSGTIAGFTTTSSSTQKQLESRFDQNLSAQNIGTEIKTFSAKPHHLGSPGSKEYAALIENKLKSYGFDTRIETYQVLFPTPKTIVLEMTAPTLYKALLKEPL